MANFAKKVLGRNTFPEPATLPGAEFGTCRVCHTPFQSLTADCEVCKVNAHFPIITDDDELDHYCP